ncbi:MAG: hypothetical protein METHAR1v1_970028 [Methanothrix sp.]|nr:MAG: hypothetical protein METHAR1v1_970028 [Methanothrix sp.]
MYKMVHLRGRLDMIGNVYRDLGSVTRDALDIYN